MKIATFIILGSLLSPIAHANLVLNGNFSDGIVNFSSQYSTNSNATVHGTGEFTIGTNPNLAHSGSINFGDHTNGTGHMLIANGASSAATYVWQQAITVAAGTEYSFSGWAASWGQIGNATDPSTANLRFVINGVQVGGDFLVEATNAQWSEFEASWNSDLATTAVVQIFDVNTAGTGNDFALDDLRFEATHAISEPGTIYLITLLLAVMILTTRLSRQRNLIPDTARCR